MTIPVKTIEITRATGFTAACGDTRRVDGWEGAREALSEIAQAVDPGRVDECDFAVTFEDGFRYEGTFNLRHPNDLRASFDLSAQVRGSCEAYLSADPHWVRFRERYDRDGSRAETMRALLEGYDLSGEDPEPPTP